MSLSRDQVMQIAELAKLTLSEDDLNQYAGQLSAILDYSARLDALNTADIPPTASVLPLENVFRDDQIVPSLPREKALANAPSALEGQFRVNAVLD
ncbi:MAG TPA: Asp-tRNA(Asn)/Glu-tRNA(Gln) amidotransferase subunit GatC [Aggregatilineales bacterium]|nr:Asp-tRNA(Asn)/Glu-tRNA(Gln) amidotransferase subunit GatC [Anaerolineales bacterium]HRE49427.1 Asp-tRNA(Asn)/Glu-tRNA(Gln) amidotransferase subunit GatC [Aggregatilineales bacterium]